MGERQNNTYIIILILIRILLLRIKTKERRKGIGSPLLSGDRDPARRLWKAGYSLWLKRNSKTNLFLTDGFGKISSFPDL